jgi:hypothetical protein
MLRAKTLIAPTLHQGKFKPLTKGKRKADLSISDDAVGSPQNATLTGART